MNNIFRLSVLMFIGLSLWSCQDTCNNKYGKTFNTVHAKDAIMNTTTQNLSLNFDINTLTELPEKYFLDSYILDLEYERSPEEVDTFYVSKGSIEIIIIATELPLANTSKEMIYYLNFGDRRSALDCSHPGMNDSYSLKLEFKLININSSYQIQNLIWTEEHYAGAI